MVAPDEIGAVVTMNSRVRCRETDTGKEYQVVLVYPEDAGGEGGSRCWRRPAARCSEPRPAST